MAKKAKSQFVCQNCGYSSPKYLGKCPNCGSWNSMVEEVIQETADRRVRTTLTGQKMQPTKIADVVPKKEPRVQTKLAELNRVLGGGVVPGSLILIGGDPGIGKSTLLLQVSQQLAAIGGTVLCVRRRKCRADQNAGAALRRHRHGILSLWGNGHVRDQ